MSQSETEASRTFRQNLADLPGVKIWLELTVVDFRPVLRVDASVPPRRTIATARHQPEDFPLVLALQIVA
jgi:hypothetical protein